MSKKTEESNINLYYMNNGQERKETIEELMKRKKAKERERRIIQNKQQKKDLNDFDLENETVINMTNRNKIKKEEQQKKEILKKQKKKKRKMKRIKIILKVLFFVLIISGGITFAICSPIFNIKDIEVLNNGQVSSESIISLSGLSTEQNIFKFLKIQIQNDIKENAYIEDVHIKRILPNKVQINITERTPKFSIPILDNYAYINSQGYILEVTQNQLNLPIINGMKTEEENINPGNRLNEKDLEKLEMVLKIMSIAKENDLDNKVTNIDINSKDDYIIYMKEEEKYIHLGDCSNLNNKMLYIISILEQEKGKQGDIFANGDLNKNFKVYFREKVKM